ncbi:MAG: DinB family protein [Gemmataceae bacterium]
MNAKEAIQTALNSNHFVLKTYLNDMSDADLLVRALSGTNHIAWQLGHLINSEQQLLSAVPGAPAAELPAGFAEQHSKETASMEPPQGFLTKNEYLQLFDKVREATLAATNQLSEQDLDKPNTGPLAQFAPTIGHLLLLIANHETMHSGQFVAIRRKLGKPVLI